MKTKAFSLFVILVLLSLAFAPAVSAAPAAAQEEPPIIGANTDNPSHPLGDKQAAQRQIGFESKLAGKTHGKVHEVAKGQFVELAREGEDTIWTVIGEFGDADPCHHTAGHLVLCTTRSPNRTAPLITRPSGRRISARRIMRTCSSPGLPALFR